VALVRRIHQLLSEEGYTIRGVQKLLAEEKAARGRSKAAELQAIRDSLSDALEEDR
jgi:DNA-binding transcriptional MerR regulator